MNRNSCTFTACHCKNSYETYIIYVLYTTKFDTISRYNKIQRGDLKRIQTLFLYSFKALGSIFVDLRIGFVAVDILFQSLDSISNCPNVCVCVSVCMYLLQVCERKLLIIVCVTKTERQNRETGSEGDEKSADIFPTAHVYIAGRYWDVMW